MTTLVDSDGLKYFKSKTDAAYLSKTGTAVHATTADRCTGNAASATIAETCTGNAATASKCTGNAATASTCTGNAATATKLSAAVTWGNVAGK